MSQEFYEKMSVKQLLDIANRVGFSGKDSEGEILPKEVLIDSILQFEGVGMLPTSRKMAKGGKVYNKAKPRKACGSREKS